MRSRTTAEPRRSVFALPAADGASAWVDARDIAGVAAAALRSAPPEGSLTLDVTGPEALTMADVAGVVSRGAGIRLRYVALDPAGAEAVLVRRLGPMGGFLAAHFAAVAAGDFAGVADTVPRVAGRPPRSLLDLVDEDPRAWRPSGPGP
jgi:uncharacterized protein YbjT (DUF2867 family)